MPINKFNTNLDLSRQAEIYSGETAVFQGGMQVGIPFSGFPTGVDTDTIVSLGTTTTERATFSGSSATTIFDVTNLSSPSYNPTHTTLRDFPYSELDVNTSVVTISAATISPLLLSYTANTGISNDPTNLVWGSPILEKLYNINDTGTTYPNNYFVEIFDNIGAGISGNTIALNETEFYQTESNNSIYSGASFNMTIYETGVHGSFPSLVTGTTSGTVTENSATTYFWSDSQYLDETSGLTIPITTLSASSQTTDYNWTLTQSTIIDGNTIGLQYTGFNLTYTFEDVVDVGTGSTPEYHGITFATRENFSAGTLDYKGDLTWINVKGNADILDRTTTNYLTIQTLGTGSPVTMLAVDSSGNVVGGSGGTVDDTGAFTSTTANNSIITTNNPLNNEVTTNHSSVLGGGGNKILSVPNYSTIAGGYGNIMSGGTGADTGRFIGGGFYNKIFDNKTQGNVIVGGISNYITRANRGFIGGGYGNRLNGDESIIIGGYQNIMTDVGSGDVTKSIIGGGEFNTISGTARYSSIIGGRNNINKNDDSHVLGSNITSVSDNTTHVENLNVSKFDGGTIQLGLGIDSNGMVVTGTTGGGGFTGNTSGSCITDLWISNLHGCSPITIHDSLVSSSASIEQLSSVTNTFIFGDSHTYTGLTTTTNPNGNTILGGINNTLDTFQIGDYNTIIGGDGNLIENRSISNIILGSTDCTINGVFVGGSSIISGQDHNIVGSPASSIIGGVGGTLTGGSVRSVMVGGLNNYMVNTTNSVILGGQNITGTTDDTVYVPNLNIQTLGGGASINNLGIDVSGNVVTGTAGGVSEATSATTTTIDFTGQTIYYDAGSPTSATTITNNLTGAKLGVIQKIYSNAASEPTYPAGWVLMGDAIYFTSTLNIIYAEWAGGTRVEYWYVQEQ